MISNLACVHKEAKIGSNVKIDPFAYIDADVVIGDNCWIGPHATVFSGSRIGNNCKVFPGAVVGAIPQDLKFAGEYTTVEIGDNTTLREAVTVNEVLQQRQNRYRKQCSTYGMRTLDTIV